ncbi:hypothetical protein [Solibacillus ferritrahens]|uniref:hypothetical protein n=1 Tax=Solibacillus ferritrahens TaxID=3098620 RepID=UPI003008FE1A
MNTIKLKENQFYIAVNLSGAKIHDIVKNNSSVRIIMSDVDLLCNFKELNFHSPDISYSDWINDKYISKEYSPEDFEHVTYLDKLVFTIDNPKFYYEGYLDSFIELLNRVDSGITDDFNHTYNFAGILDKDYDEFEICTNNPIEMSYEPIMLDLSIQSHLNSETTISKISINDPANKLRKNNSSNNLELSFY